MQKFEGAAPTEGWNMVEKVDLAFRSVLLVDQSLHIFLAERGMNCNWSGTCPILNLHLFWRY